MLFAISLILSLGMQPMPSPRTTFYGAGGLVVRGGSVCVYKSRTHILEITWRDSGRTQPNTNPVMLGWDGSAEIFLKRGHIYSFVVRPMGAPSLCGDKDPYVLFIDGIHP